MNLIDKILLKENINHLAFLFEEVKKDITETEEFKAWFGNSKVVDSSGKPLVVYHGTGSEFEEFSKDFMGDNWHGDLGDGFYFTNKKMIASEFAKDVGGSTILNVYLSLKNPARNSDILTDDIQLVLDDDMGFNDMSDVLSKKGFDGIEYTHSDGSIEYVVFEPNQIKSVNNKGTFDSGSDNIMESTESNSLESEARKYDSFEEFKAYGFDVILKDLKGIERDTIVIIPTEKVEIKWKEDYDNALETAKKEYNPKTAEPVDLIYDFKKDKYILDDGHNRYVSAQRNNQPIRGVINHIEGNLEELEELYNKERDITLTDIWNNSR